MIKKKNYWLILTLLPFALLVIAFEVLPVLMIVLQSFKTEAGAFTLENYRTVLSAPFYLQGMRNSLAIALESTVIGLAVSVIAVGNIRRLSARGTERVIMLSNLTSNFAGVPLAFAFMILLGNNGVFTLLLSQWGLPVFQGFNLYSATGLALVYVYFQIPLGILLMYPAFDAVRAEWKEAAGTLGASTVDFWRHIGIPALMPGMAATFSILFANAMGAYATAYALTSANFNLITIRIGALISGDVFLNPSLAGALAVVLGALLIGCSMLSETLMKRGKAGET